MCEITDASQIGEARRLSGKLAASAGFGEVERGKLALVVTELGTNMLRHAKRGEFIFTVESGESSVRIQVLALDKGPGMHNLERCIQDGYSTAGTPGKGLGAVVRLSDEFDAFSEPGMGTAVVSRIRAVSANRPQADQAQSGYHLSVGAVSKPIAGEEVCGDGWAMAARPNGHVVIVVDGLGHGLTAAEATWEALRLFEKHHERRPTEILEAAHAGMRSTRGAAAAVVELDLEAREVRFAGVGNISGSIFTDGRSQSMVSHNGTVGHQLRKVQEFTYPWPKGALVILHSDGLATQWRLDRYPGLAFRDTALVAGVLYRDFARVRDDITVLALREGQPAATFGLR